jgi:hypothetical protein
LGEIQVSEQENNIHNESYGKGYFAYGYQWLW